MNHNSNMFLLFVSCFICSLAHELRHYNSELHFKRLIFLENELISFCRTVLEQEQRVHEQERDHFHDYTHVHDFLSEVEPINNAALDEWEKVASNPLEVFHLRRRLANTWPDIIEQMTQCKMVTSMPAINNRLATIHKVLDRDTNMEQSIADLLRLMATYEIPRSHVLAGWLGQTQATPLGLDDIVDIATFLGDHGQNEEALEWLVEGVMEAKNMNLNKPQRLRVMGIVARIHVSLGNVELAKGMYDNILKQDPNNQMAERSSKLLAQKIEYIQKKKERREAKIAAGEEVEREYVEEKSNHTGQQEWMKWCRSGGYVENTEDPSLMCYEKEIKHEVEDSALVEELHKYPRVVRIHNIISEEDLELMVKNVKEKQWQKMINYKGFWDEHSSTIYTDTHRDVGWVQRIDQRLRNITFHDKPVHNNMILSMIKVCNHGAGGSDYPIHSENIHLYHGPSPQPIGRYIIFLSEPTLGGDIVFPGLKLTVKPIKGSAIFWQFREPTSPSHPKLESYIECPILIGSQWTAKILLEHQGVLKRITF